ncbi:hypothetical protein CGRA01v4_09334 [Colletotrichum graminicola]|nr:hypothetical protein CGRA01v4_09334 [Colletotrichum graminicola]
MHPKRAGANSTRTHRPEPPAANGTLGRDVMRNPLDPGPSSIHLKETSCSPLGPGTSYIPPPSPPASKRHLLGSMPAIARSILASTSHNRRWLPDADADADACTSLLVTNRQEAQTIEIPAKFQARVSRKAAGKQSPRRYSLMPFAPALRLIVARTRFILWRLSWAGHPCC